MMLVDDRAGSAPLLKPCLLWHKSCGRGGYGHWWYRGKLQKAHRVAWAVAYNAGVLPALCVLHKCDVRACVEPSHLFLGTKADNIVDMVAKGRQRGAVGSQNGNVKLRVAQVEEIRAASRQYGQQRRLAQQLCVCR